MIWEKGTGKTFTDIMRIWAPPCTVYLGPWALAIPYPELNTSIVWWTTDGSDLFYGWMLVNMTKPNVWSVVQTTWSSDVPYSDTSSLPMPSSILRAILWKSIIPDSRKYGFSNSPRNLVCKSSISIAVNHTPFPALMGYVTEALGSLTSQHRYMRKPLFTLRHSWSR